MSGNRSARLKEELIPTTIRSIEYLKSIIPSLENYNEIQETKNRIDELTTNANKILIESFLDFHSLLSWYEVLARIQTLSASDNLKLENELFKKNQDNNSSKNPDDLQLTIDIYVSIKLSIYLQDRLSKGNGSKFFGGCDKNEKAQAVLRLLDIIRTQQLDTGERAKTKGLIEALNDPTFARAIREEDKLGKLVTHFVNLGYFNKITPLEKLGIKPKFPPIILQT